MDRPQNDIAGSLELHLFFARIMKEHALFLKLGLFPPNQALAAEGEFLLRKFDVILSRTISLSDHVVRNSVLKSGEIVTAYTKQAEYQTQRYTGTAIDRELTARELSLHGANGEPPTYISPSLSRHVHQLNRDALVTVNRLIQYKENLLQSAISCKLFTANYPLLIEHILREARLYRMLIRSLEGMNQESCDQLNQTDPFWNQIMMEHALFIRGLLDPSEETLIHTADDFATDYKRLLEACQSANDRISAHGSALSITEKFRDFKQAGVEGIEACKLRSIILPLLADHVLREANHYLRLLDETQP